MWTPASASARLISTSQLRSPVMIRLRNLHVSHSVSLRFAQNRFPHEQSSYLLHVSPCLAIPICCAIAASWNAHSARLSSRIGGSPFPKLSLWTASVHGRGKCFSGLLYINPVVLTPLMDRSKECVNVLVRQLLRSRRCRRALQLSEPSSKLREV